MRYRLTEAGQELRPVVEALGSWGIRWIGELGEADLDPKLLLWDMHRNVDWRAVVKFVFPDVSRHLRSWWLVITTDDADVCDADPEYPVEVTVTAPLALMTRIWRGDLDWSSALRAGRLTLEGPTASCRALPAWFTLSTFAAVTRPRASGGVWS